MDQMLTFNISQDDDESDTSQEDLDDSNVLDELDSMGAVGEQHSSSSPSRTAAEIVERKYKETFQKWARKEEPPLNVGEPLKFMLLDSDFSIISANKIDPLVTCILPQNLRSQMQHSYNRLYGVTEKGQSVLVNAFGFVPYFYATPSHPDAFDQNFLDEFEQTLNTEIIKKIQSRLATVVPYHDIVNNSPPILEIQVLNAADVNIYEFHQARKRSGGAGQAKSKKRKTDKDNGATNKILKVFCRMPKFVWTAVQILKKGLVSCPVVDGQVCYYQTFEGSINHNIRYLTDMNFSGCSWLEVPAGKYFQRQSSSKVSHCQFEMDAHYRSIVPASTQLDTIPPLRILSLDIECMTRPPLFEFPRGGVDKVLQIGTILTTYSEKSLKEKDKGIEKFMFMLGSCDELEGTQVFSFQDETEMLEAWRLFVTLTDPDILMGYNIKRFDLPFLLDRAGIIKAKTLPYFGRIKQSECVSRPIKNGTKKAIKFDENSVSTSGRVILDMMIMVMRHNTKGGPCKLIDVADRYLRCERKLDVPHTEIFNLQKGGPTTRKRLASYCVQDARLPYLIMLEHNPNQAKSRNFNTLSYYIDKARASGTPLRYLVTKSPEYNTYFKVIRKHKHPEVTFVPNTPLKGFFNAKLGGKQNNPPLVSRKAQAMVKNAEKAIASTSSSAKGTHSSAPALPTVAANTFCFRDELAQAMANKDRGTASTSNVNLSETAVVPKKFYFSKKLFTDKIDSKGNGPE